MPKNNYFLLRHGQTPYQLKKDKIIYPWPEPKPLLLTKKGKEEIKSIAKKLKKEKIDLIFSSDLPRTRQTAEIIAEETGSKIVYDQRLREINVGIFRGRKIKEYYDYFSSPEEMFWKAPQKGENLREVQKRVFDFFKEIDKKYNRKNILIVSHGDPLWLLEGKIKKKSDAELIKEKLEGKTIKIGELRKL